MADVIALTMILIIVVLIHLSRIILKSYKLRRSPLSGNVEPTRGKVSNMMTTSLLIQRELLKQGGYVREKVAQKPMLDTILEENEDENEDQHQAISEPSTCPKDLTTAAKKDVKDIEAKERKVRVMTKRETRSIDQHITRIRVANIEKKRKFENQSLSNNLKSTSDEPKTTGQSARCTRRREQAALKHVERIRGYVKK